MKRLLAFIFILVTSHQSPVTVSAQNLPTSAPKVLPFQQQAQPQVSDQQLAMQLFQAKDYEKAVELYEKLYKEQPTSFYYMYYLHCLIELKEFKGAEKLIKGQRKNDPRAIKYLVDLGYLYYREGDGNKARKLYEEALGELGPDQQQIFDLANAFLLKGENGFAIEVYLRGRELLKGSYPFSFELANVYQRTGNFAGMFEEYLNLLEVNESYLATVQDRLQNTLADDPENAKNEQFRVALLTRVQRNPESPAYADLLWWYAIQQKDFELALIQSKALDRRRQEQGGRILQLAQLAVANDQFQVALDAYAYLTGKGEAYPYYDISRVEWVNTRFLQLTSGSNPSEKELSLLQKEFLQTLEYVGENRTSVVLMQNLAHLEAFYMGNPDEAQDLLYRAIEMKDIGPTEKAFCKLELGDILLFFGDVWEATLLYQQVYQDFKYDVLGQTAKFKNTKLSFYIGEFGWAKAQADILKAATDKMIANDALALSILIGENYDPDSATVGLFIYSRADLLSYKNQDLKALQLLDSIPMLFGYHPLLDDVLLKKAGIYSKLGEYSIADSLYHKVTTDYPDEVTADRALFLQAGLREKEMNDPKMAMELYARLLERYPSSIYTIDARKMYRILRGDRIE
ncbi:MAG: tetratricopeptide repeat protein [Bacteroidales bacterium]|nr:tetratricopeptide repeat protein [Bacteroidales bacterium]